MLNIAERIAVTDVGNNSADKSPDFKNDGNGLVIKSSLSGLAFDVRGGCIREQSAFLASTMGFYVFRTT